MTKLYFSMRFDSANIEFHTLASNVVVRERIVLISSDAFGAFSRQPLMARGTAELCPSWAPDDVGYLTQEIETIPRNPPS